MNSLIWLLLFCICCVSTENWTGYLKLDSNYEIWWSIEANWITFQIEAATRGWVGFGISPNGGMAGSDVVIGWVSNGKATFHDRYAEGNFQPEIDDHQDWQFLWCCQNDTHTNIRFKRLLTTCHDQDLPITDETTRLIYAYHPDDPSSVDNVMYHGTKRRGTKSVLLKNLESVPRSDENSADIHHWIVRSPDVRLPRDKDSQYFCSFIKRPNLDKKHHIIQVSPLIRSGNERFIRRMTLYQCLVQEEKILPHLKEKYHICYHKDMVPKFPFCLSSNILWAVGGGNIYFPENVGLPFGTSHIIWYLLEVHYDNSGLEQEIIDNSGLKITYTPRLRQYDGSMLAIGSLWHPCLFVPPKQKEFIVWGHAHPSCFKHQIPPEGIKVFSTLLHSHTIGKRMTVRHFRGEVELQPLIRERNYDFNYQEYRFLSKERIILPDDHLVVECTYDSSNRTEPTYGGFSTKQEMCLAFLAYYPKVNISGAVSCPLLSDVLKPLEVKQTSKDGRFVVSPITGKNESYYDFLNTYSWDKYSVKGLQRAMKYSPHSNFCFNTEGGERITSSVFARYPRIKYSYEEFDMCETGSQREVDTISNSSTTVRPRPINSTWWPEPSYPPRVRPPSGKPGKGFPPAIRPTSRKPERGFPPRIRTTRNPPDDATSKIRTPSRGFPPNVRSDTTTITTTTTTTTTAKPTSKIVPHVFPYPLIDEVIGNFG